LTDVHTLMSKEFFPSLIAGPFKDGIVDVLIFAAAMCLMAALASWLRGGKFVHEEALAVHGHEPKRAHGRPGELAKGEARD